METVEALCAQIRQHIHQERGALHVAFRTQLLNDARQSADPWLAVWVLRLLEGNEQPEDPNRMGVSCCVEMRFIDGAYTCPAHPDARPYITPEVIAAHGLPAWLIDYIGYNPTPGGAG